MRKIICLILLVGLICGCVSTGMSNVSKDKQIEMANKASNGT